MPQFFNSEYHCSRIMPAHKKRNINSTVERSCQHFISKEAEKVRHHNSNYCPHSFLHKDTHVLTRYTGKGEKILATELIFNQPFSLSLGNNLSSKKTEVLLITSTLLLLKAENTYWNTTKRNKRLNSFQKFCSSQQNVR